MSYEGTSLWMTAFNAVAEILIRLEGLYVRNIRGVVIMQYFFWIK